MEWLIISAIGLYLIYKFWAVIIKWVIIFSICSFIFFVCKDTVVEKMKEVPILSLIVS
jgi:hypothetical protein